MDNIFPYYENYPMHVGVKGCARLVNDDSRRHFKQYFRTVSYNETRGMTQITYTFIKVNCIGLATGTGI